MLCSALSITAIKYWELEASKFSNQEGLLNLINQEEHSTELYRTKTIYLEEGDSRGGLEHIMQRHENDFTSKLGISGKQEVAKKIYKIVKMGDWCTHGYQKDSRGGFSLCYQINERLYLIMVVSNKGFIVTAYPRPKVKNKDWDWKEKIEE